MSFRNEPSSTRSRTFASILALKTSIPQLTISVGGWSPFLHSPCRSFPQQRVVRGPGLDERRAFTT